MVLSGFDAKLQMLDSAGGNGGGRNDYSGYQDGPGFGGSAGSTGGAPNFENDLDDEVPF